MPTAQQIPKIFIENVEYNFFIKIVFTQPRAKIYSQYFAYSKQDVSLYYQKSKHLIHVNYLQSYAASYFRYHLPINAIRQHPSFFYLEQIQLFLSSMLLHHN